MKSEQHCISDMQVCIRIL